MRIVARVVLAVLGVVLSSAASLAFQLCPNQRLAAGVLYVLENGGCWTEVKNIGLYEGELDQSAVPKLFARASSTTFAYVIAQPSSYRSAVVIKKRVFRPHSVLGADGTLKPAGDRTSDVILKRAAIQSVCDKKDDLDQIAARLNRDFMRVNVNIYNRYHSQPRNFIPATSELREFHFRYPVGPTCRTTNDIENRAQYVLLGLVSVEPTVPIVSWLVSYVTAAQAENLYYSKLEVENAFVNGRETFMDQSHREYSVIRFNADSKIGTRLEITISDLENRLGGSSTWQVDWN